MHLLPRAVYIAEPQQQRPNKQQQQQHQEQQGAARSDSDTWGVRTPETLTTAPHSPLERKELFVLTATQGPLGGYAGGSQQPTEAPYNKQGLLERLTYLRQQLTAGLHQQQQQQQQRHEGTHTSLLPTLSNVQQTTGAPEELTCPRRGPLAAAAAVSPTLTGTAAAAAATAEIGSRISCLDLAATPATAVSPAPADASSSGRSGFCSNVSSNSSSKAAGLRLVPKEGPSPTPGGVSPRPSSSRNSSSNNNSSSSSTGTLSPYLQQVSPLSSGKVQQKASGAECSNNSSSCANSSSSTLSRGSLAAAVLQLQQLQQQQQQHQLQQQQEHRQLQLPRLRKRASSMVPTSIYYVYYVYMYIYMYIYIHNI